MRRKRFERCLASACSYRTCTPRSVPTACSFLASDVTRAFALKARAIRVPDTETMRNATALPALPIAIREAAVVATLSSRYRLPLQSDRPRANPRGHLVMKPFRIAMSTLRAPAGAAIPEEDTVSV